MDVAYLEKRLEEMAQSIMIQSGMMITARLDNIEERLLPEQRVRPPLAADRRVASSFTIDTAPEARPPRLPVHRKVVGKKGGQKEGTATTETVTPTPSTYKVQVANTRPPVEEWVEVGKGGKAKKTANQKGMAPPKKAAPKLKASKSEAIALTLQPEALKRGATYSQVLTKLWDDINLGTFGIERVKYKRAATGAVLIEVPGSTSGPKVDALAEKIKALKCKGQ